MNNLYVKLQKLFQDRVFKTFVLAVLFILSMGLSQTTIISGLHWNDYWARKSDWYHCADVVLAGDSRVSCGLSPEEMGKYMPGYKILNYGFGGAWFSTLYMDKIETVMDPDSDRKIIVLGISPHSLIKHNAESGNFFEVITMTKTEKFFYTHFPEYLHFFEPLSFQDAIKQLRTRPSREELENNGAFYPDGWTSGNKIPGTVDEVVNKYAGYYKESLVDTDNIDNIISYAEKWIRQGINVYAFFPPSCKEMHKLEMERSGIEESELISKFEQAGGVWIDVDPYGYVSFDGTHLQRDSALELSKLIAKTIFEYENHK